jgi:hypothetical protein
MMRLPRARSFNLVWLRGLKRKKEKEKKIPHSDVAIAWFMGLRFPHTED